MKMINVFSLILILVSAAACKPLSKEQLDEYKRKQGIGEGGQSNADLTVENMRGNWITACDEDAAKSGMYRIDVLEMNSNYHTLVSRFFSDNKCTKGIYNISKNGTFTIDTITKTIAMKYTNSSGYVLPLTSIIVDSFIAEVFCNITNWKNNELKPIPDLSVCKKVTLATQDSISLYIDGTNSEKDALYLGSVKLTRTR